MSKKNLCPNCGAMREKLEIVREQLREQDAERVRLLARLMAYKTAADATLIDLKRTGKALRVVVGGE